MILSLILLSVLCTTVMSAGETACPEIVTRTLWGAEEVTASCTLPALATAVENVIIHHIPGVVCDPTDGCNEQLQNIQAYHMGDGKLKDIAYNFLIDKDGKAYAGRGWITAGYHTKNFNDKSIAIAYIGTLTGTALSDEVKTAITDLIACGVEEEAINAEKQTVIIAHLHKGETPVPADPLLIKEIEELLKEP